MNQKAFENIISFYKANYSKIEKQELYKWKAVQTFQDNWDIDAEDFHGMLQRSLHDTSNLMSAGNYYPRRMILWMAEKDEDTVRGMFRELYDLTIDFKVRIENFRETAKLLVEMYKEKNVHHHYQDDRAIMVYLNLRYPEKYYLYKYTMFKDFVERIDYDEAPKSGEIENLFRFESLCNYIHNYIMQDEELLKLYEPRKEKYYDPEYHLLVQDIIYTTYYEAEPDMLEPVQIVKPTQFKHKAVKQPIELKGEFIDYMEREKRLKQIGELGEQFIFSQEREKVKQYHLPSNKKVAWVSRDKGDGLGFDILSYDAEGNEMYIEVKTTLGTEDSSFFISANELEKSKLYAENYYLYRVYEFDMKNVQGKYSVRKGSLEDLCLVPQTYRVDLKEKNANEESDN